MKFIVKTRIRLLRKSNKLYEELPSLLDRADKLLDKMLNKHLTPLEMERTAKEFHEVRKKIFRNMGLAEILSRLAGRRK